GMPLPATAVFDHPTPALLAELLAAGLAGPADTAPDDALSTPSRSGEDDPIAVVGMACRFPGGVRSADDLWRLVLDGAEGITAFPTDRGWDLARVVDTTRTRPGTSYTDRGGFIDGATDFDADFFGISPREAMAMDPQQRLLLETAWEAIEHAGI